MEKLNPEHIDWPRLKEICQGDVNLMWSLNEILPVEHKYENQDFTQVNKKVMVTVDKGIDKILFTSENMIIYEDPDGWICMLNGKLKDGGTITKLKKKMKLKTKYHLFMIAIIIFLGSCLTLFVIAMNHIMDGYINPI